VFVGSATHNDQRIIKHHPTLETHLVVSRPYESIVAKVPADISRNDFSVDTILWNEILIRTSRGLLLRSRGSVSSISVLITSRHDAKIRWKRLKEGRKQFPEKEMEGLRVTHTKSA